MDALFSRVDPSQAREFLELRHQAPKAERPARRWRDATKRDRDRILYSSAFQRLANVTQVTAPEAGHVFHNRLTHSLKVAQVGRRNAERLHDLAAGGEITGEARRLALALDPDSVEASCLAHDLGHPPFGHIAEAALNDVAREEVGDVFDAFEGNAQSLRIVARLSVRDELQGLNLTRRTLNAMLKYPWAYSPNEQEKAHRKWGYYGGEDDGDKDAFDFARETAWSRAPEESRCLEAEIMDWADDLTYAVHDVDDFFRAGLIPLDRLGQAGPEVETLLRLLDETNEADPLALGGLSADDLVRCLEAPLSLYGPESSYVHTASMRAQMRHFGSELITRYLDGFRLIDDPATGLPGLEIDPSARQEVEALKLLVRVYVIRRPGLAVVQHGQERVVRCLFQRYFEASKRGTSGDRRLFPVAARERLKDCDGSERARARIVIDLIAGLTEESAIALHQGLEGGWPATRALDATADIG
jgi:dGTPase